ncbi:MAG: hypothetical protein WA208_02800, partial [Thermoanaerobaculia bacterium]
IPNAPFDERIEATAADLSVRAAAIGGRVTRLETFLTTAPARPLLAPSARSLPQTVYFLLLIATTAAGAFLARRNFRARRVDTVAAGRVAFWVFATRAVHILLTGQHPLSLDKEPAFLAMILGSSLLLAAEVWLGYTALEPYVRRRWPRVMVTWTRLVHGAWNDRFVGRAILFGVTGGLLLRLVDHVRNALPALLPVAVIPSQLAVEAISSVRRTVGGLLLYQSHAIFYGLFGVFVLVLLKWLVRREWIAALLWVGAMTVTWSRWEDVRIDGPIVAVQMALMLIVLYRAGLLGFATAIYVHLLTVYTPMTADLSAIYFPQSAIAAAAIVTLAAFGALTAMRWRSSRSPEHFS